MPGLLNEELLPDDYPIYGDYFYVVDGRVYRSDWHGITAGDLKRRLNASEVRRCDLIARQAQADVEDREDDSWVHDMDMESR